MPRQLPTSPVDFTTLRLLVHAAGHQGPYRQNIDRVAEVVRAGGVEPSELAAARAVLAEMTTDLEASQARLAHMTADRDAVPRRGASSFDLNTIMSDDVEMARLVVRRDRRFVEAAQAVLDRLTR